MPQEFQTRYDVLIVGAGHGGSGAAIALRRLKYEGTIGIVSLERDLPYERPPLSKDYLSGERGLDRLLMRPQQFWTDQRIDLLLGREAVAIDVDAHKLQLGDGSSIGYGSLIWAPGGKARRLSCSGYDLPGVHSIRNRTDVDALKSELDGSASVVVIGGGYIGLEAAAVLSKLGKKVTVLEAADRLLARVSSAPLSQFFEAEHQKHGVEVRLGVTVDCIAELTGGSLGVLLEDGTMIPADLVIVGIGIEPSNSPIEAAGALCGAGVRVDEFCRTNLPDVFAVGDCVEYANPFAGGAILRLESVQNAQDQATTVAKFLTGQQVPYDVVPWFWSEQYDFRLQTIGVALGHDDIVVRGDPDAPGFSLLYLKDKRVIALDCINKVKDYVQGRLLITSGAIVSHDQLADPEIPLKSLAATALK